MLSSSILVSIITVLCGLLGFLVQAILAKQFGANLRMDGYLIGTSLPTFVAGSLGAALSYTLTPHLVRERLRGDQFSNHFSQLFRLILCLVIPIFISGFLFTPQIIRLLNPNIPEKMLPEIWLVARISWITGIIAIANTYLVGVLNSEDRFITPALTYIFPYVFSFFSLATFGPSMGPSALAFGLAGGTLASSLLLAFSTSNTIRLLPLNLAGLGAGIPYIRQIPLFLLAMFCFAVFQSIDAIWGSRLAPGSLATLGYGQRLLIAIGNLVISGPSAVLMPQLTRTHQQEDPEAFLALVAKILQLVLACAAFLAITVTMLAQPIIRLMFARGAFDEVATARLVGILPMMLTGMVSMLMVVMAFRVLFAQQQYARPAIIGVLTVCSYFLGSWLLSRYFGIRGIATAYAISWTIGLIASLFSIWGQVGLINLIRSNVLFLGRLAGALLSTSIGLYLGAIPMASLLGAQGGMRLLSGLALSGVWSLFLFWITGVKVFKIQVLVLLEQRLFSLLSSRISKSPAKATTVERTP